MILPPTCSWMTHDRFASSICKSRPLPIRSAFSLLEVIIALAILAGSAMVLFSLLNMGSQFGQIAHRRTVALATANSILEELIATSRIDPSNTEITGVVGQSDPLGYRVRVVPFGQPSPNTGDALKLQHITVEIFSSEIGGGTTEQKPLCTLSRVVRTRAKIDDAASRNDSNSGVTYQ